MIEGDEMPAINLTLTNVVFECNCFLANVTSYSYLTLTNVVFELSPEFPLDEP